MGWHRGGAFVFLDFGLRISGGVLVVKTINGLTATEEMVNVMFGETNKCSIIGAPKNFPRNVIATTGGWCMD